MTDAKQVPLHELLQSVPADARLVIDDADGKGTRYIPVGRYCHEAAAMLAAAQQQQAEPAQMPIARITVRGNSAELVNLYAPGLPDGEHDLFCAPCSPDGQWAPSMFAEQQAEPVWIQPDHLQKARVYPFLCRVEPKRRDDFVPLYTSPRITAGQIEPVAFADEHVDTFLTQYNDVYCDQRKAGVGGGDAERAAMRQVLILAFGAYKPRITTAQVEQQDEPVAYLCPAGCGCTWRDNKDGSMSLFGHNSRSCATCEHLPLSGLIPVYYPPLPVPRITTAQVAELKRLADEAERSAVDVAVAECAVMMVDPGIKYKRQQLDEDRAALHAALDALVAKE